MTVRGKIIFIFEKKENDKNKKDWKRIETLFGANFSDLVIDKRELRGKEKKIKTIERILRNKSFPPDGSMERKRNNDRNDESFYRIRLYTTRCTSSMYYDYPGNIGSVSSWRSLAEGMGQVNALH